MARKGTVIWEMKTTGGRKYALRQDGILLVHYGVAGDSWKRAAMQLREDIRGDSAAHARLRQKLMVEQGALP